LRRVLKPGGRLLFSDALIIGGLLSHEEIAKLYWNVFLQPTRRK
jgi:hypothetical protein